MKEKQTESKAGKKGEERGLKNKTNTKWPASAIGRTTAQEQKEQKEEDVERKKKKKKRKENDSKNDKTKISEKGTRREERELDA